MMAKLRIRFMFVMGVLSTLIAGLNTGRRASGESPTATGTAESHTKPHAKIPRKMGQFRIIRRMYVVHCKTLNVAIAQLITVHQYSAPSIWVN
jgi:hypothetical protein